MPLIALQRLLARIVGLPARRVGLPSQWSNTSRKNNAPPKLSERHNDVLFLMMTDDEQMTAIACARQDIRDVEDAVRCGHADRALDMLVCAETHMRQLWERMVGRAGEGG